jgi:hypothetical protein
LETVPWDTPAWVATSFMLVDDLRGTGTPEGRAARDGRGGD